MQIINNIAPETSPVHPCINSQKISCEGIFWIMKYTEIHGSKSIRNLHLFAFVSKFLKVDSEVVGKYCTQLQSFE